MPTLIRAFLMLRTGDAEWSVTVHRDLEGLLAAWKARPHPETATGVIHVGFDRPPSMEFDPLARGYPGRALVTAAAAFALPSDFRVSKTQVGQVRSLPVYVGARGWGYIIDTTDDGTIPLPETAAPERVVEGWLATFRERAPDAAEQLRSANIWNDTDYIAREAHLPTQFRHQAGLHRLNFLIGTDRDDPCAFCTGGTTLALRASVRNDEFDGQGSKCLRQYGNNEGWRLGRAHPGPTSPHTEFRQEIGRRPYGVLGICTYRRSI